VLKYTVPVCKRDVRIGAEADRETWSHGSRSLIHPFDQILHGARPHRHVAGGGIDLDRPNVEHVRGEIEIAIQRCA
jgi:hypothetical protein